MKGVSEQSETEGFAVVDGPGRHLREARESRNLTVAQVAAQLRLQPRIIEALEGDDYSTLPGSTFVQGYLRSYSRLLELADDHIVGLAQLDSVAMPALINSISETEIESSSRDLPFRVMSLLIFLVVVVGLLWWLSQHEPMPAESTPSSDQSADQTMPQTAGGEQSLPLPEEREYQSDDAPLVTEQGEADGADTVPAAAAATTGREDAAAAVAVQSGSPVVEPAAAPRVTSPATPPALTAAMPQSRLELEYREKSWTEISDAAGRKLAYGLIPEGKRLTLRGEAPFRVFLGYANGVIVYYNGELYDHTPFQSGDMARFRLGRAGHNRPVSR
jgi:cytoskeleton protein RodZ